MEIVGKCHLLSDEETVIHKIINCSEVHMWTENILNRKCLSKNEEIPYKKLKGFAKFS
jgi:hypothetical protein